MSDDSAKTNDKERDVCNNQAERLLNHLIADNEAYHNHKETMAHAGLLVMLGLCSAILLEEVWPPCWVSTIPSILCPRQIAMLAFLFLWILLNTYIRWQMRNRRTAAIMQAAAFSILTRGGSGSPESIYLDEDSEHKGNQGKPPCGRRLITLLDHIVPVPAAPLANDIKGKSYPTWLRNAIEEQEREGTGALTGEWLITFASFFALIIVAIRTLASLLPIFFILLPVVLTVWVWAWERGSTVHRGEDRVATPDDTDRHQQ